MAFFPPVAEEGYATPSALVLSLAIAMAVAATVNRSAALLRLARADLERTRAEYVLAGAQLEAAAAIVRTGEPGPFHWSGATEIGADDIVAQREGDKLALSAAADLDPSLLAKFGVADPEGLRVKLAEAATQGGSEPPNVAELDPSPLWHVCGARVVSPFGQQGVYRYTPDAQPTVGDKPAWWRVGEVWRVRVATAAGWRDDRIVRFTGDASHPVAVVARWLSRGEGEGGRCEDLQKAVAAAYGTTRATP